MYIKAKCLSELIDIKPITYDDLRKNILNIFTQRVYIPKSVRRHPDRTKVFIYLLKCEHVYQYIATSLGRIARLPKTNMLHSFYAELINIASDNMYDKLIEEAALCIRILTNLWKKYRKAILRSTPNEAKAYAQEFIGRTMSIVKRKLKIMPILNEVIKTAKTTPCINFNDPIIIVSGMPQVGKSTLVGRISSAKPLVSPYPFTTKNIIIGHIDFKYVKIQIIDTPGLLDRNIDEMNEIERKAIATLKHLNSVVLYLIDPTQEAYYSFERQISSLKTVEQLIGKEKIIIVLNKIDKTPKELLIGYENMLKYSGYIDIVMISALHGINIEELIYKAISKYDELYNTNYKQFLHK
jgi:nucleolar GTP-binding protein